MWEEHLEPHGGRGVNWGHTGEDLPTCGGIAKGVQRAKFLHGASNTMTDRSIDRVVCKKKLLFRSLQGHSEQVW